MKKGYGYRHVIKRGEKTYNEKIMRREKDYTREKIDDLSRVWGACHVMPLWVLSRNTYNFIFVV